MDSDLNGDQSDLVNRTEYVIRNNTGPKAFIFKDLRGVEVGRLTVENKTLVFRGQVDAAAAAFFAAVMYKFDYLIEDARRLQRDLDIGMIEKQVGTANVGFFTDLLKNRGL